MERASGVFQSLKESVGLFTAGFVDKGDHYELKGLWLLRVCVYGIPARYPTLIVSLHTHNPESVPAQFKPEDIQTTVSGRISAPSQSQV